MATFRRGPGGAPEAICRPPRIKGQWGGRGGHPLPTILPAPGGLRKGPGRRGSWGSLEAGPIPGREGGGRQPPPGGSGPPSPWATGSEAGQPSGGDMGCWLGPAQMHPCRPCSSDQGSPRHPEAPDHHELDTPPFGPNHATAQMHHPRPDAPTIRPRRLRFVHPPGPDPRRGASKLTPLASRLGLRC